jgi:endogenous inhibitor of DNA gyrase (YacG/DUF329 family)
MSQSWEVKAVVGITLEWDRITYIETISYPSCRCSSFRLNRPEEEKYCKECGKELSIMEKEITYFKPFVSSKATKVDVGYIDETSETKIGKFNVDSALNNGSVNINGKGHEGVFVGLRLPYLEEHWHGYSLYGGKVDVKDLDFSEVKTELRKTLEPLGLWEEDRFGLHLWIDHSF